MRTLRKSAAVSTVILMLAAACTVIAFSVGVGTSTGTRLLVISVVMLAFPGIGAWLAYRLLPDLMSGSVSVAEGRVPPAEERTQIRRQTVWSFYLVLDGGQRFQVPGKAYAALRAGRYRIFFLPRSRRVVGVEPIDAGE